MKHINVHQQTGDAHVKHSSKLHLNNHSLFLVLLLGVVTSFLTSCSEKQNTAENSEPTVTANTLRFAKDAPALQRLTMVSASTPQDVVLNLPGRLVWDEDHTSRIVSPVAGRITEIKAQVGSNVTSNQVLAYLASAELGTAQTESARAQYDLAQAERSAARSKDLAEAGIIARKDLEQSQTDLARAKAEASRTQLRTKSLGAGNSVDQRFALRSPIAGVVVERNTNPGMEWRPDQPGATLFVVSDPTYLWCMIDVPESAASRFQPGQKINIHASALPQNVFEAKVDYISDSLDPASRTLKVRARLRNSQRQLKSEMYVTASLVFTPKDGIEVPAKSVVLSEGAQYIFLNTGEGQFMRQAIAGTNLGKNRTLINSDVKAGDRVVADGALYLQQFFKGGKTAVANASQ